MIGVLTGGLALCQAASAVHTPKGNPLPGNSAIQACPKGQLLDETLADASSLLQESEFQQAVRFLRAKSALDCDPRADLLLAAAFDGSHNIPAAKRTLEEAHRVWPSNINLATSLARYYLQEGKSAAAERVIRRCKPTSATSLRELQVIAMSYLENHDLARAKSVAVIAFRAYPSEQTLLFTANVLQMQGRFMNVLVLLRKYRQEYGNSSRFLITIAESEYDGMMYGAAHRDLEKAASLAPGSYPVHYLLGNVLVKTGHPKRGIAQYKKAISLSPKEPRTYYRLGLTLEAQGETEEAKQYFKKALHVDQQYAPAYCQLGKLQFRAHKLREAAQDLSLAIKYNPSIQESYYLLIQTYARLGEKSKSQVVLAEWSAYKKTHHLRPAALNRKHPLATAP